MTCHTPQLGGHGVGAAGDAAGLRGSAAARRGGAAGGRHQERPPPPHLP